MEDAIRATLEIMEAPKDALKIRSSYNLAGISFTPKELAMAIKKFIPQFSISYAPDFRQLIANSWPNSIDDSQAQLDWQWKHKYDLDALAEIMLKHIDLSVE
jgi:nucleoside-diphosphate-sugar epimerase